MSDNTKETPVPTPPVDASPAQEEPSGKAETQEVDFKAESRKWEARAKENAGAAARLAEIEDAAKSDAQKAADREAAATKRADEAEARVIRRDVALEHGLSKDDAALLDGLTDETAMNTLAARLAVVSDKNSKKNVVPREGDNPTPADSKEAQARAFFGIT